MPRFTQKERSRIVGGSDAGTILGLNPYQTAVDLYMEKRGLTDPQPESLPMRHGTVLEEFVAMLYLESKSNGFTLAEPPIWHHSDHEWMVAHLDRIVMDNKKTICGLECKTANPFMIKDWGPEGSDEIPAMYVAQVQHYMAVTGLSYFELAVLIGSAEFRKYRIDRSDEFIEKMIPLEEEFINGVIADNLSGRSENGPDIDNTKSSEKLLALINPADADNPPIEIDRDHPIFPVLTDLRGIKAELKELEGKEQAAKNLIMEFMGSSTKLKGPDLTVSWHTVKRTKTAWKEIAENNILEEQLKKLIKSHTTESKSRTFLPKFK